MAFSKPVRYYYLAVVVLMVLTGSIFINGYYVNILLKLHCHEIESVTCKE